MKHLLALSPPWDDEDELEKYSPDQPRDEAGRWTDDGTATDGGPAGEWHGTPLSAESLLEAAGELVRTPVIPVRPGTDLTEFLAGVAASDSPAEGDKYESMVGLVYDRGEAFPAGALSPKEAGVEQGQLGWCFNNALKLVVDHPGEYRYVEGFAKPHLEGGPEAVATHAWVQRVSDGAVVDNTWSDPKSGVDLGKTRYFGVVFPTRYVMDFAMRKGKMGILVNPGEFEKFRKEGWAYVERLAKYDPSQPRDEQGRWTSGNQAEGGTGDAQDRIAEGGAAGIRGILESWGVGRGKPEGWRYATPGEFVLKNGQAMTAIPKPDDVPQGRLKECYQNAFKLADDHPELYRYVEGYAMPPGIPMPIEHAWVQRISDGAVIDNTWSHPRLAHDLPHTEYLGVPFSHAYILRTALARGYYGILDNPQEHFPLLREGESHAQHR